MNASSSSSTSVNTRSFLLGALSMFVLGQLVELVSNSKTQLISYIPAEERGLSLNIIEEDSSIIIEKQEKCASPTKPSLERKKFQYTPLTDLVNISKPVVCRSGMYPVKQIHNAEADKTQDRRIPRIVHMTGKTGCLTKPFYENMKRWSFENHSFYFHDDDAVDGLFNKDWPMFPQLKNSIECLKDAGGAAKADLWRYLALWEYGGIYTDMDNAPGKLFNASTITPDMDAFFVQERGGFLSQYFFAVSPHHPLMFLTVQEVMRAMHDTADIGKFYVPEYTGPGAIKRAFLNFMGYQGASKEESSKIYKKYAKPRRGHYVGKVNKDHNVTVVGTAGTTNLWCQRSNVASGDKSKQWRASNVTEYRKVNRAARYLTCQMALYNKYEKEYPSQQQLFLEQYPQ